MRRTIYLPDDLNEQVEEYLRDHPGMTLSALVQSVLRPRVRRLDPYALLELSGFIKDIHPSTAVQPEDQVVGHES